MNSDYYECINRDSEEQLDQPHRIQQRGFMTKIDQSRYFLNIAAIKTLVNSYFGVRQVLVYPYILHKYLYI